MLHTLHNRFRLLFYIFFLLFVLWARTMNVIRKKAEHGMNYSRLQHFAFQETESYVCVCIFGIRQVWTSFVYSFLSDFAQFVAVYFIFLRYIRITHTHMNSPLALTIFGLAAWLTHNGRFSGFLQLLLLLSLSCFIFIPLSVCVCCRQFTHLFYVTVPVCVCVSISVSRVVLPSQTRWQPCDIVCDFGIG